MSAEREMDIMEWCSRLPESHKVNRQLRSLMSESRILEALYAGGVSGWEWYFDSLEAAGLVEPDEDEEDE